MLVLRNMHQGLAFETALGPLLTGEGLWLIRNSAGGAVVQLGARQIGILEVTGSNPVGSTKFLF